LPGLSGPTDEFFSGPRNDWRPHQLRPGFRISGAQPGFAGPGREFCHALGAADSIAGLMRGGQRGGSGFLESL